MYLLLVVLFGKGWVMRKTLGELFLLVCVAVMALGNLSIIMPSVEAQPPAPCMYLVGASSSSGQTFYTNSTSVGTLFNVTGWVDTVETSTGWSAALDFNASQLQVVTCVFSGTGGAESQWFQSSGIPESGLIAEAAYWNNTAGTVGEPSGFGETTLPPYVATSDLGSLFIVEFNITEAPPPGGSLSSVVQWDSNSSYAFDVNGFGESGFNFGNFNYTFVSSVLPSQDVAVTNVTKSKTVVGQGLCMNVTVTAADLGSNAVTFNLTVYANTTVAVSQNVTLSAQTSANVTLVWNATGFARGNYTVSAYAWPVPGETNIANNNFTDGWVIVSILGDITGQNGWPDGIVNMRDVAMVARAFGTTPGSPYWNANADLNNDGTVDMKDVALVARNFGQHT
jgi:hypothetical protein